MSRIVVAVLLVAGCATATTTVPVLSEAPGVKRVPTAGMGKPVHHEHPVKHRHRRHAASRSLHRLPWGPWRHLVVTAYCYTGSRNAAGKWPTAGTAAANAYPLGTRLEVQGVGLVVVEDRSAPGATDVDIYLGAQSDCQAVAAEFGRRELLVRVAA